MIHDDYINQVSSNYISCLASERPDAQKKTASRQSQQPSIPQRSPKTELYISSGPGYNEDFSFQNLFRLAIPSHPIESEFHSRSIAHFFFEGNSRSLVLRVKFSRVVGMYSPPSLRIHYMIASTSQSGSMSLSETLSCVRNQAWVRLGYGYVQRPLLKFL